MKKQKIWICKIEGLYINGKVIRKKRCSVCKKIATKEIQVIWKGKDKYIPRCNLHIIKGYKGKIRNIKFGGKAQHSSQA